MQSQHVSGTESGFVAFLKRKNVTLSPKVYFIQAMSYMALGLFSSLLIGSILNTVGVKFDIPLFTETLWPLAKDMTGPAIAVAVAYALQAPALVMFSVTTVGAAGAALGGPVGAFVAALIATECGKLVANETKVDILVTPAVTIIIGVAVGTFIGPYIGNAMTSLGDVIMYATQLHPFLMGMMVAVLMGMALTLPISSAAIAIMLSLNGLAAGAATVGCCVQMVGFAVMSFRENRWAGLVAQGLGTSMLQMPNIIKNRKIWLPTILTSAILGPVSTLIFAMENTPLGAGMGTSGFVGQIQTVMALDAAGWSSSATYSAILLMHFVLPAVLTLFFAEVMRKMGWIKPGDLALHLS
ncbi:PTS transporter subunit IIC [Photobacterium aphoticum]|uniref:PTS sugar transporter subunit IID n=1 Tax=Photobacterium aphoticum TaxID=754436 RepID=A0A090QLK1_9GAMM|nr:PTS sugar transporter subunit IIC [Photobacterium aphoticum]KLV01851.1 PTS sugar transporter subunit IID [Photobacterium aphoticum]PSU60081.1 PTS sugar transporter subunit IIC [Photobacterium aphoticum]GAL02704.1 predicted nicotinate-regulated transporter BH3254 [Photobacterium aphoticum]GHA33035.1 PTS sugar transporter subunit IID [Photobacterium aphoticum]